MKAKQPDGEKAFQVRRQAVRVQWHMGGRATAIVFAMLAACPQLQDGALPGSDTDYEGIETCLYSTVLSFSIFGSELT